MDLLKTEAIMVKSWSDTKKILECELLCAVLRGRVRYNYTIYRRAHDGAGLFEVRIDGEVFFRATPFYETHYDQVFNTFREEYGVEAWAEWDGYEREYETIARKAALQSAYDGVVDSYYVLDSIRQYLNQDIATSLHDENAVVRMIAILDRRVGKRTLRSIADQIAEQPVWLRWFYYLRFEAEGIEVPS